MDIRVGSENFFIVWDNFKNFVLLGFSGLRNPMASLFLSQNLQKNLENSNFSWTFSYFLCKIIRFFKILRRWTSSWIKMGLYSHNKKGWYDYDQALNHRICHLTKHLRHSRVPHITWKNFIEKDSRELHKTYKDNTKNPPSKNRKIQYIQHFLHVFCRRSKFAARFLDANKQNAKNAIERAPSSAPRFSQINSPLRFFFCGISFRLSPVEHFNIGGLSQVIFARVILIILLIGFIFFLVEKYI